ncbi:cytochrome P450 [Chytriomyces sp. MP71]|nr:cytochrome P450 [Chytriomyces sp. MP71]
MFNDLTAQFQARTSAPSPAWFLLGISTYSPRVTKVQKYLHTFLNEVIKGKQASKERPEKEKDLMDRLLSNDVNGVRRFTESEVIGQTIGFFLAGHHTTFTSATFVILELSRNHAVQMKLKQEISSVTSKLGSPTFETLSEYKYLDSVIREAQRLHSVASTVMRQALTSIEHNGGTIFPKTLIVVNMGGMHRCSKHWEDPNQFKPERWNHPIPPHTFLPFGDGPHSCIGKKLGLIELKMVLISLLSQFSVEIVEGQEINFVTHLTYGLTGLKVRLIPDHPCEE